MNRTEVDTKTGEIISIPLTPAEIADAEARTAAEQNDPVHKKLLLLNDPDWPSVDEWLMAITNGGTELAALKIRVNEVMTRHP